MYLAYQKGGGFGGRPSKGLISVGGEIGGSRRRESAGLRWLSLGGTFLGWLVGWLDIWAAKLFI